MYLLDTNHCSRLLDGDSRVADRIAAVGETNVVTSVIVQGELIYMAENSDRRQANLIRVRAFLHDIQLYFVDDASADAYGQMKAALIRHFGPRDRSKRHKTRMERIGIGENDLWIAAVALRHHLTVVSSDTDFERIREAVPIQLENWLAAPDTTVSGA